MVGGTLLSGCVSSKKFKELEARYNSCSDARVALEADTLQTNNQYRRLQEEKAALETTASSDIAALSGQLNEKESTLQEQQRTLREREARLRELEGLVEKQQATLKNLLGRVQNALGGFGSDELTVQMREGRVYVSLSENLLFKSGRTDVDPKGADALQKLAQELARNPDITVMIEGHTDDVPIRRSARFEDNWDLSVLRATSIVRILNDNGVSPQQTVASGRGEYAPVASNDDQAGRSQNRRTEIILSPQLEELYELMGQQPGTDE